MMQKKILNKHIEKKILNRLRLLKKNSVKHKRNYEIF